jgi:hypothetical protein
MYNSGKKSVKKTCDFSILEDETPPSESGFAFAGIISAHLMLNIFTNELKEISS